jgi:WD40 repeat protein
MFSCAGRMHVGRSPISGLGGAVWRGTRLCLLAPMVMGVSVSMASDQVCAATGSAVDAPRLVQVGDTRSPVIHVSDIYTVDTSQREIHWRVSSDVAPDPAPAAGRVGAVTPRPGEHLMLCGWVRDESGVASVSCDGRPAATRPATRHELDEMGWPDGSAFEAPVAAKTGATAEVTVVATGLAGNASHVTIGLRMDGPPGPEVLVLDPSPTRGIQVSVRAQYPEHLIRVYGLARGNAAIVRVTVAGKEAAIEEAAADELRRLGWKAPVLRFEAHISSSSVASLRTALVEALDAAGVRAVVRVPVVCAGLATPSAQSHAQPELVPQVGFWGTARSVAFSPDGKTLASGHDFGNVVLWDVATRRMKRTLRTSPSGVCDWVDGLAFSPDGQVLAASTMNAIAFWDVRSYRRQGGITGSCISSIAFSPDSHALAYLELDRTVTLFDLRSHAVIRRLRAHRKGQRVYYTQEVGAVAFSPDGKLLVSTSDVGIPPNLPSMDRTSESTGEIYIWSASTGRLLRTLRGHRDEVTSAAFSPDGSLLASGSSDKSVILWDLAAGKPKRTLREHADVVTSVAFSPDGGTLASGAVDGTVRIWDAMSGALLGTRHLKSGPVNAVAFSPRVRMVAWGSGSAMYSPVGGLGSVGLWDMGVGELSLSSGLSAQRVLGVSYSPAEDLLAAVTEQSVVLWSTATGEARRTIATPRDTSDRRGDYSERIYGAVGGGQLIAFSPDGRLLAVGGPGRLQLVSIDDGRVQREMDCKDVGYVAFGERGASLLANGDLIDLRTGLVLRTFLGLPVALSPVGDLVVGSLRPWTGQGVDLWDSRTWTTRWSVPLFMNYTALVFSPDGGMIGCLSDVRAELRDARTGRLLPPSLHLPASYDYRSLAFGPDGRTLVLGGLTLAVLDTATGWVRRSFRGGTGMIKGIACAPDGRTLASGSDDGAIRVWDVEKGKLRATLLSLDEGGQWLTTTPEGYFDCSLEAAPNVVFRIGERIYPFDQFEGKYLRPDLVRKALAGGDISGAPVLDGSQIPPDLIFAFPAYGEEANGDAVEVELQAAGVYPIQRVELTVNGRAAPVEQALTVAQPTEKVRTFRVTVPLPPNEVQVRLRAVAYDTQALRSRPAELYLRRPRVKEQPSKLYLLSVGVSKYQTPEWNTLQYADADARAFAETFARQQRDEYAGIATQVLVNEEATVSRLKFALRDLKDRATEADVVTIFVAGHGVERGGEYYFLCHDTQEADLALTALSGEDFVSLLREVRAKRVLLFVDTCHAGFATGWRTQEQLLDRLNRQAGVAVFAASRGEEVSLERPEWGHGAFTKGLLEGLQGKADQGKDGTVSLQELRDYVTARVEELAGQAQHPYLPRVQQFEPETAVSVQAPPEG